MNLLEAALNYAAHGCSVIPVTPDGSKKPGVAWKALQTTPAGESTLRSWFTNEDAFDGLGIITGTVSGNLELLEVEGRALHLVPHIAALLADSGLGDLWARLCAGWLVQSPSGGLHWLYRVDGGPVAGNTKLARRPATPDELDANPRERIKVLIETRGEGGYLVTAPSGGRTHPTGRPWTIVAGGVETCPVISVDERDRLFAICTMFDTMPADTRPTGETMRPASTRSTGDTLRPGDDYDQKATWAEILEPRGWTRAHRLRGPSGDGWAWTRPGKKTRDGISATTGTRGDGDNLYVWSTSTEFDTETPYSKFGAITHLEHGGDFAAAARALRKAGYGGDLSEPRTLTFHGPPEPPRPSLSVVPGSGGTNTPTDGSTALKIAQAGSDVPQHVNVTLSDDGNAVLLATRHGTGFRYVPEQGRWLQWDGLRWRPCPDVGAITAAARETIHAIAPREDLDRKHKLRSLSRRSLEAMVALARCDPTLTVPDRELDADPYQLCTPAGVVDLRTGQVTAPDPAQLNTKLTGVAPDNAAPATRWLKFLDETFEHDQAVIGFVHRLAGYSLTGLTTHHVLPFLYGAGGNGKGVFLEVLLEVLGDYATTAPSGFLMATREQHETEIARLDRMRLVVCSEVNQNDRFDEAKVKVLTGGDHLTARYMRQDYFTFEPTHKLWLMGNHQPRVGAGGESFWRRLRLLPFTRIVPKEEQIKGLAKQFIEQEGAAILAWLIDGARHALTDGLVEPPSVLAATETYASEEDALARFVADRCHLGPAELRVNTADMRSAYETWCRREGERPISPQMFGRELRARWQVGDAKSNGARFYTGVTLVVDEPSEGQLGWWQK